jgi:rhodanese-related sulfurtransferase
MSVLSMERDEPGGTLRGVVVILITGILLGAGYNYLGLKSNPAWGLSWIAEDRGFDDPVIGATEAPTFTDVVDPLAPVAGYAPEIPAVGRPVQVDLPALKQLVDAGAILLVDAREADEFAVGHIPGAISLPHDLAITDPELLENLDTGGRPVVAYCGGGGCELSRGLAEELIYAGHERVAYYNGGLPEWVEAGYPTATGAAGEAP